ncbi:MAG: hypothetical protein KGH53_01150 [Candidatus Micrarchaeota archaeon]|nr:hypothetical protein [Candidatus Micrarchaeota archaeon]
MRYKNQVFIPTVAEFKEDIQTSMSIQKPLAEAGYATGLMLVIRGGKRGVTLGEIISKQYSNISAIYEPFQGAEMSAIALMLSNMPIEEIDFLHSPRHSAEHVMKGVDFARKMPVNFERKILTFHLNSLVTKSEFLSLSEAQWKREFSQTMYPALMQVSNYAKKNGIEIKVETVPVPEFGDIPSSDTRRYRGAKLSELRNPFYFTSSWGFSQAREAGLGICLDLSHSRTIYEVAKNTDSTDPESSLFKGDYGLLKGRSLLDDVMDLERTDIVHLNDGAGNYLSNPERVFKENLVLGEGEIKDLKKMVRRLDEKGIAYVLEIGETNFKERPNTAASIKYLLESAQT